MTVEKRRVNFGDSRKDRGLDEVNVLRNALQQRGDLTRLRATAHKLGMNPIGLRGFIEGGSAVRLKPCVESDDAAAGVHLRRQGTRVVRGHANPPKWRQVRTGTTARRKKPALPHPAPSTSACSTATSSRRRPVRKSEAGLENTLITGWFESAW